MVITTSGTPGSGYPTPKPKPDAPVEASPPEELDTDEEA